MSRGIRTATIVLVAMLLAFVVGLTVTGQATTGDDCRTFTNHSGYLPDEYDYGIFIEYDPPVEITSTHSEDPRDYGAGSRWDKVKKCKYPTTTTTVVTTTTSTSTTSTTVPPTTTTVPPTTTTIPPTTTTVPETTTTVPETTTTVPETTTTTVVVTTSSTVLPTTTTTTPELPFTGPENMALLVISGLGLVALGGLLVRGRREA